MSIKKLLSDVGIKLTGATAPRPSGQLSGHAGGLVFEEMAHSELVTLAPGRAFRHFEALNVALEDCFQRGDELSKVRFGEPALHYLVSRGERANKGWSLNHPFEEKQNDTAESIVFSDANLKFQSPCVSLIDIKSQNINKQSQPPNIISANKLLNAAELILQNGQEPKFEIIYLGVKFAPIERDGHELLEAREWRSVELFKIDPASLYINWAAALQIQFHPFEVEETFDGTRKEWFASFLRDCYLPSLKHRIDKQQTRLEEITALLTNYN